MRTPHWYLLWTILAINVTAGAALISVAAPLVQELAHVSPALGALAVCLISLFNGIGRLGAPHRICLHVVFGECILQHLAIHIGRNLDPETVQNSRRKIDDLGAL